MRDILDDLPADLHDHALTHPAFASTHAESFERLEYLGDKVLGLAVADEAYRRWPDAAEGELTRIVNAVVSRDTCAKVARTHDLGRCMLDLARARSVANLTQIEPYADQRNTLAALVESVIGAGFRARGYDATAPRVVRAFEQHLSDAREFKGDAKSRLQLWAAAQSAGDPRYDDVAAEGPPHNPTFTVAVLVGDDSAEGTGRSKQEAQQSAAATLLQRLDDRE